MFVLFTRGRTTDPLLVKPCKFNWIKVSSAWRQWGWKILNPDTEIQNRISFLFLTDFKKFQLHTFTGKHLQNTSVWYRLWFLKYKWSCISQPRCWWFKLYKHYLLSRLKIWKCENVFRPSCSQTDNTSNALLFLFFIFSYQRLPLLSNRFRPHLFQEIITRVKVCRVDFRQFNFSL